MPGQLVTPNVLWAAATDCHIECRTRSCILPIDADARMHRETPRNLDTLLPRIGYDGIIAKRRDSSYDPGVRSDSWQCVTCRANDQWFTVKVMFADLSIADPALQPVCV
jgi:hypothetical protein